MYSTGVNNWEECDGPWGSMAIAGVLGVGKPHPPRVAGFHRHSVEQERPAEGYVIIFRWS